MTVGERGLARLLACVFASAAIGAALLLYFERLGRVRDEIRGCRLRIERLSNLNVDEEAARARLRRISESLERTERRRAAASSASVAALGREAMRLLAVRGIATMKYLFTSGKGGERIELSIRGRPQEILRFIQGAAETEGWSIPYLSLKPAAEAGLIEAVVRLGP
jgi:hypothetical protein